MIIYLLVVMVFTANGTAVPVVQGRTLDAAECSHYAQVLKARGTTAFCAVEELDATVSNM